MSQLYFVLNTISNEVVARFEGSTSSKKASRYLVTNNLSEEDHKILDVSKKSNHDFFDCYTIENGVIVELPSAEESRAQRKTTELIIENEALSSVLDVILDELNALRVLITPLEPDITKDDMLTKIKAKLPK